MVTPETIMYIAKIAGGGIVSFLSYKFLDKMAVQILVKYFPNYFLPFLNRQFIKINNSIESSKRKNHKIKKTISTLERQLIESLESFIRILKT